VIKRWFTLVLVALVLSALPILAQQATPTTNTLSFNSISFSYDTALGLNVNIQPFGGDAVDVLQPGGAQPPSVTFYLYNDFANATGTAAADASVSVYRVDDLAPYTGYQDQLTALQMLLTNLPDLTTYESAEATATLLPFLPVYPAGQVLRASTNYVQSAGFNGVSYITVYRQDVSPFLADEFVYTIQALSSDGAYYVSAIQQITVDAFPAAAEAFDPAAFSANFDAYLLESVARVEAADTVIAPATTLLDDLVSSLTIGLPGMTPDLRLTPQIQPPIEATATAIVNTDPTLGGLLGTWTLVSYGDPAAPTLALSAEDSMGGNAALITFSAEGVNGTSGCNGFGGGFTYDNSTITFTQLIGTLMACEGIMEQEQALLGGLPSATTYTIIDDTLTINYTTADGLPGVFTFTKTV